MSEHRASVAIFQREVTYPEGSRPFVSSELFEAALRITADKKGCEIVKTRNGLYIVQYSDSGPWQEKSVAGEYLQVWIARIHSWSSGGIKKGEMDEYLTSKENGNDS